MNKSITIYSDEIIVPLIKQLTNDYRVVYKELNNLSINDESDQGGVIFLNASFEKEELKFSKLSNDYLVLSNLKLNFPKENKNLIFVKTPITISQIQNHIKKFISNRRIFFDNVCIKNKKLTNLDNNKFTYLTEVENKILLILIEERKCNKDLFKEKILNIKSNIETYSLDSHLTRIRKKIESIETKIKIQTKGNELFLFNSINTDL